jgi:hypothetical protein
MGVRLLPRVELITSIFSKFKHYNLDLKDALSQSHVRYKHTYYAESVVFLSYTIRH